MQPMRRFLALGAGTLLIVAACSSGATATPVAPKSATPSATTAPASAVAPASVAPVSAAPSGAVPSGVTITIWDFFPPAPSPERDALVKVANDWAAKTGNKVVDPGQIANAVDKFKLAAPSGQGPDIIMQPQDQEGGLVAAGLLAPVPSGLLTADEQAGYNPVSLTALTYKGALYGLPFAEESYFLFYNKKLVSTPPTTWDALKTQAQSLTHGGQYGFLWDTTNFYYDYAFIAGFGGYLFKLTPAGYDPSQLGLTSAGSIQGLSFIQGLTQTEKLVPPATTTDIMEGEFSNGKAAMIIDGPWAVAGFKSKGIDFGVAPLPNLTSSQPMVPFVGIQGLYVSAKSPNQAAAWDLVKYLSQNAEAPLYAASGRVPVLKALAQANPVASDPVAQAVIHSASVGVPMPNVPAMSTVWTPMAAELQLLVNGRATPQAVAAGAEQKIKQAIAALGG